MEESNAIVWPHWIERIKESLSVTSQIFMSGNVHDIHMLRRTDVDETISTVNCLKAFYRCYGCEFLVIYDLVEGVRIYGDISEEQARNRLQELKIELPSSALPSLSGLMQLIAAITSNRELRCVFVIDYASRLLSRPPDLADDQFLFFAGCQKLLDTINRRRSGINGEDMPFNPVIWLLDRPNDLPSWFGAGSEQVLRLSIECPDRDTRTAFAREIVPSLPGYDELDDVKRAKAFGDFAGLTDGLSLRGMRQVREISRGAGIPISRVADAVRCYKVGTPDNPWRQEYLRERLRDGEVYIGERVKGQTNAIQKVLDILKRSVVGLAGAQSVVPGTKPRGVLFFAGPTGVGKTELAKSIAGLLFGDEANYIRFDMSEFTAEHSDARLVGAPPGYIGYDAGGELVNAIRQRPFSVVLFDEIEKAHPRILDKFLQILDEGRLTDGRGETVYFSEAVIVFTSNLGIYVREGRGEHEQRVLNVQPGTPYDEVQTRVRKAIDDEFRFELNRPELLNRIGENIVVFNFIEPDVATQILDKMINNVIKRVFDEQQIRLQVSPAAKAILIKSCTRDLAHGGRGIGNQLENVLINPLARALFDDEPAPGSVVEIATIDERNRVYSVVLA